MSTGRAIGLAALILLSAILQAALSEQMSIAHARPDIVLVMLLCSGVLIGNSSAIYYSVWAGFLTAVISGFNYGSFMVSRLIAGTCSGWLQQHVIQNSIVVPPLVVFTGSMFCEALYFLMAPSLHELSWWFKTVLRESLYNAVLSLPVYFGLRAMGFGKRVEHGYEPFMELP